MLTLTAPKILTSGVTAPIADTLHVSVLGPPVVDIEGRTVSFRSRKEFALLVYLAFSRTQHSREHLASLLWPDHDETSARGALRTTLSRLRQAVARAAGTSAEEITLIGTGRDALGQEVVRLMHEGAPLLMLDTAPVEAAAAPCDDGMDLAVHEAQLRGAVSAYRGPFLAEVHFDDAPELEEWVDEQRAFWQRKVETLLGRLTALQLERRAFTAAGATAERWIEISPEAEAAYRALMRASVGAGDRAGALAVYENCRAALRTLGLEPSPETVALAEQQRRLVAPAEPPLPRPGPTSPTPSTCSARQAPVPGADGLGRDQRALNLPFVGRGREFAALVEAYQAVRAGASRAVVIAGEARIGKSRLVEVFLDWATLEGADVLRAPGLALGDELAYQLLVDALRPRLAREHAPEDLIDDVWLAELARLFPELRERYPDLPAAAALQDDPTGQGRLFEAVYQLKRAFVHRAQPGVRAFSSVGFGSRLGAEQ